MFFVCLSVLQWKLDRLWRVLETPSQLPALLGMVQIQISHLSIWKAQPRFWYRNWSGASGGREHLLCLWLKLLHSKKNLHNSVDQRRTKRKYNCITSQFVQSPGRRRSAYHPCSYTYLHAFIWKNHWITLKKTPDPMFFVSTFCLIGLCVSGLCRRSPYQK